MSEFHEITHLHQIIIVDGYKTPLSFPPQIQVNIDCARTLYPNASYRIWNGEEIREFIRRDFDTDVLWAFDTLAPYSYKCDLGRFCLLFAIGGIYLDLGVRLMGHWRIPTFYGFAAFRDVAFISRSWATIQTGLIWSKPGRPELERSIQFIIENCRKKYYGEGALYPTGPVPFGRAIIAAMVAKGWSIEADDQRIGECRCITPDREMLNVAYVSREKTLIALRTKVIPGDLAHLGIAGGNNYNNLWRSRRVYGETEHFWNFDDSRIGVRNTLARNNEGIRVPTGTSGRITWGPWIDLEAGSYELKLNFSKGTKAMRIFVDVSSEYGRQILWEGVIQQPFKEGIFEVGVQFTVETDVRAVECRLTVFEDFCGLLKSITLRMLPERCWKHDNERIRVVNGIRRKQGIVVPMGTRGIVTHGPYVRIPQGAYVLKLSFDEEKTRFGTIEVDISADVGKRILRHLTFERKMFRKTQPIELSFATVTPLNEAEFRFYARENFEGVFLGFTLTRQESNGMDGIRPFST
jgi:hypothetical protein